MIPFAANATATAAVKIAHATFSHLILKTVFYIKYK